MADETEKKHHDKSPLLRVGLHNWLTVIGIIGSGLLFVYREMSEIKTNQIRGQDQIQNLNTTMERVEKGMHGRMDNQDSRMNRAESRLDGHESRISRLEVKGEEHNRGRQSD